MTISAKIRSQLFIEKDSTESTGAPPTTTTTTDTVAPLSFANADAEIVLIRLPLTRPLPGPRKRKSRAKKRLPNQNGLGWSDEEHERFLRGLEIYPTGPWKTVAAYIGTRTTRQVMTHAQKYRQKIMRRQRGLQIPVRKLSSPHPRCGDASSKAIQKEAKPLKTGTPKKLSIATAARPLITLPPSPAEQTLNDLNLHLSSFLVSEKPIVNSCYSFSDLAMTEDEFRLATDELYAEALWADQFENDDERLAALVNDIVDDPLMFMF